MTEKEEIEKLRKDVQFYSDKYFKLRGEFIELKTSSLKFKIKNKVDRIFSVLLVFLKTSEGGVTVWTRLKMFTKTMWAWARNGFKLEDEQTSQARLEICEECPHLKKPNYQCDMCGCMMKKKTTILGAACPLSKW
tara:strand:- start:245 stop:649 length:405 start_codon:yes stop_codon:yes gene_type:complete